MATTTNKDTPQWPRDGYDPEWLALEDASGGRFILTGDISKAAEDFNTTFAAISKTWPPIEEPLDVWDDSTGPSHGNMPVRFYKPKSHGKDALPLMIHFPGGGFFSGNLDTEDHQARFFAAKIPCVVMSVNYPLAPAMNIDGIIEHGIMAVEWARLKSRTLATNPKQILLCGGSAGGVLSAQVAHHYTSTKQHGVLAGCILLYVGVIHWTYSGKYKAMHRSWEENGHAQVPLFGLDEAAEMWSGLGFRPDDPRHFPFMAKDLSGFPPCYLVSVEKDCWRDDGKMFEMRLKEARVKCRYDYYPGLPHWFHVFPQLSASHEMMEKTVQGARFLLEQS